MYLYFASRRVSYKVYKKIKMDVATRWSVKRPMIAWRDKKPLKTNRNQREKNTIKRRYNSTFHVDDSLPCLSSRQTIFKPIQ